ncbi:LUD domain-containing protein [Pedobacter sp. SD-b]|uniref:LUD domain-containing protein n=1 Tax=Pedobacter segetis TaxID=2793069 RepID=A0ABS1BMN8_9SPHI|nr:LUD domain-containing protein [Pedobacter segetis]MBK0384148.1 LUD domain-containing protein [Pedobacter segetis]
MNSRACILNAVKENQPELLALPDITHLLEVENQDLVAEFTRVIEGIGAKVFQVNKYQEIIHHLKADFETEKVRVVSTLKEFDEIAKPFSGLDNHELADVELMILPTHFAVAENGASWVDDELFKERVLPFIPQHLVFIVEKEKIVPTMHHAYQLIGKKKYSYGTFIAGPSKTADIEQSLVLGAHGPRSLRVFLV